MRRIRTPTLTPYTLKRQRATAPGILSSEGRLRLLDCMIGAAERAFFPIEHTGKKRVDGLEPTTFSLEG